MRAIATYRPPIFSQFYFTVSVEPILAPGCQKNNPSVLAGCESAPIEIIADDVLLLELP